MKRAFVDAIPKCWDWINFQYFVEDPHTGDQNTGAIPMPAQGTKYYERVGNKIRLTRLRSRGVVQRTGLNTLPTDDTVLRWMIVYDRQFNAASVAPSIEDLLGGGDSVYGEFKNILGYINPEYADRFVILFDKFWNVPATTATSAAGAWYELNVVADSNSLKYDIDIDLRGLDLYSTFDGSGKCTTGQIFVVSDSGYNSVPANQHGAWGMNFLTRFEFEDL